MSPRIASVSSLVAAFFAMAVMFSATPRAEAAVPCSCVQYVQNYLGLPSGGGFTNAEDMGIQLKAEGFVKLSQPQAGAVVIFNHNHPYVDPVAGHVGIILEVQSYNNDAQWKLLVRSANLYGQTNYFTHSGCTNVSDTWFTPFSKSATTVSYWARPATPAPPPSSDFDGDEVQAYWANLVGDDREDALVYNPVAGGYAIWDFSTDTQARSGGWSPGWTHVVLGNFTGDYHTDAIVYNKSKGAGDEISAVLIDFNPPGGTYQQVRTYSWSPVWTDIIGGNFVGDGWDELLFYKSTVGGAVVWDPRTDSLLVSKSWSAGWTHVIRGNFAGDSHTDVLVYNSAKTTGNVVVTDFAAGQQTFVGSWSTGWTHIVPGDMVGDSHTDVLAYSTNRVTAAVVNFSGNPSIPYDLGTGFTNVVTGDLLGDTKHEALLYSATTGRVIVFNFSSGTKAVDRTWSTGWAQTLTGNFVGDSKRDVLVYNPNTGVAAIVSFSPSYDQPWSRTWSKGWIVYS